MARHENESIGVLSLIGSDIGGTRVLIRDRNGKVLMASGDKIPDDTSSFIKGTIFIQTGPGGFAIEGKSTGSYFSY